MAFHTSLPVALARLCGMAALLLAVSAIAAAPPATDNVYIWRDQSGALRFSAVDHGQPPADAQPSAPAPADPRESETSR